MLALVGLSLLGPTLPAVARGQGRFADEVTIGTKLPATTLAGDQDATAVSTNPAGLVALGDWHLELAFTGLVEDRAEGPGAGFALFGAAPLRLPFLPKLAFGFGIEQLTPPRVALAPDPGSPLRLSLAGAYEWQGGVAFGLAWRTFSDDGGAAIDGVQALDFGATLRAGRHFALGAVVRDLNTPVVGGVPTQRHWGLEVVARPGGTNRFEIGVGAELGERRLDLDPRLTLAVRLLPGLTLRGEVATLSRFQLVDPGASGGETEERVGVRASLGLEVSFGRVGVVAYGTAGVGAARGRGAGFDGATVVARWSGERLATVVPPGPHMEQLEIAGAMSQRQLTALILDLRRIERDDQIRAVFVKIDGVGLGWAGIQDLRDAFARLRARKKKVVTYLVAATTRDYYLASAADRVLLDAAGGIRLQGLVGVTLYYKGLFDKLGVTAQFEKIQEFKSAPEVFTQGGPSKEAKMVRDALFDDIYERLVADVAADRKLDPGKLKAIIDRGPYTAPEAGELGLVDAVVEADGFEDALAKALGGRLLPVGAPEKARADTWALPKIAVIYVEGDIIDGESRQVPLWGSDLVGGDTIAKAIAWARDNPEIEAIVVRVDSPGGSALASELMARELETAREVKPVIVSMGDIAASGGYFCAALGERIFAQPSTITGSIGIFTGKVEVSGLMARLGIGLDITSRGSRAAQDTFYRPYTDEERAAIYDKLHYYYGRFVKTVAKGRGMSEAAVDEVARGRVWTGAQAMTRGLVDTRGGIYEAIAEAKRQAGYGDGARVEIVSLPAPPTGLIGAVLKLVGAGEGAGEGEQGVLAALAGVPQVADLVRALPWALLMAPETPQARLPFAIVWE
jgi:protease-4